MKTGTPYWSIGIHNEKLRQALTRSEYFQKQKEVRAEILAILDNRLDFKTEAEAKAAHKKIPKRLQSWVWVSECIPVSLGLGWC